MCSLPAPSPLAITDYFADLQSSPTPPHPPPVSHFAEREQMVKQKLNGSKWKQKLTKKRSFFSLHDKLSVNKQLLKESLKASSY